MSPSLVITNFQEVKLSLTSEFHLLRAEALEKAVTIKAVTDKDSMELAVNAIATLKGLLKGLESSREAVKRPIIDLGREIEAIAAKAKSELTAEGVRLNGYVQEFYREEERKAEATRKFAEKMAESRRLKEKQAADAAEAERLRLEEVAKQSTDASEAGEAAKLAEEAASLAEEAAKRAEDAANRAEEVRAQKAATPTRVEGMTVRKTWKHEVTDIAALYKVRPELVTLDSKTNEINIAIRQGGLRECAGLRIFEETDTTVRA